MSSCIFLFLFMKAASFSPLFFSSSPYNNFIPSHLLPTFFLSATTFSFAKCLVSQSGFAASYSSCNSHMTRKDYCGTASVDPAHSRIFCLLTQRKLLHKHPGISKTCHSPGRSSIPASTSSRSNRNQMAWRSSGNTNKELVDRLRDNCIIQSPDVYNAMIKVDRANFVHTLPYEDSPQPIGHCATISAPHMHAYGLQFLSGNLKEGNRALDVGSGTGYLTACFAHMVGATEGKGMVVGIDCVDELVEKSKINIEKQDPKLLASGHFKIYKGDGWKGDKENGPYNAIHVGAAASETPPALLEQLAPGGQLVVPVDAAHGYGQHLKIITKDAHTGEFIEQNLMDVSYVPLRKDPDMH